MKRRVEIDQLTVEEILETRAAYDHTAEVRAIGPALCIVIAPSEAEVEALEGKLAENGWTLTRAEANIFEAERTGTHPMRAAAVTAKALRRSINIQLASEAASKDDWAPSGPSIVQGEAN